MVEKHGYFLLIPGHEIMDCLKKTFFLSALLLLFSCPCLQLAQAQDNGPMPVFTSLAPVTFVAQEIGGDRVTVHTLIPPGRDPHTFSPTPRQVVALSQARIYFTVALTFEDELRGRLAAGNSELRFVDCSAGIARRPLDDHHHEGQGDPHIWLGTKPLARMAQNICAALSQATPQDQAHFEKNLDHFLERLAQLESELNRLLAPYQGRSFLVFHPSFGYFAESFGLHQEAVEIEGKSPSPQQLTALIKLARAQDIRVIFVQPQFDRRAAERMAQAIGATVLPLDPLAADVFANLQTLAEKIATTLGK